MKIDSYGMTIALILYFLGIHFDKVGLKFHIQVQQQRYRRLTVTTN
jgi:hypothetical protein